MELAGRTVRFHLSPEGKRALKGLVPASGSFQALVVATEDLGLLIRKSVERATRDAASVPVMLLRWDYIATMTFDYQVQESAERVPIGFSPHK